MPVKKRELRVAPGPEILRDFLQEHSSMFNLTEIERMCKLPNGSFRLIRTGSRNLRPDQYKKLRDAVLPKMCEFVFLLQNYSPEESSLKIDY
jgi:hypothetical protein